MASGHLDAAEALLLPLLARQARAAAAVEGGGRPAADPLTRLPALKAAASLLVAQVLFAVNASSDASQSLFLPFLCSPLCLPPGHCQT